MFPQCDQIVLCCNENIFTTTSMHLLISYFSQLHRGTFESQVQQLCQMFIFRRACIDDRNRFAVGFQPPEAPNSRNQTNINMLKYYLHLCTLLHTWQCSVPSAANSVQKITVISNNLWAPKAMLLNIERNSAIKDHQKSESVPCHQG